MLPAMLASPTTVPNPFSIRSAPAFRATLRSMPPLRVMLSLRVLVATFAALVLVPIASAGCPHQGGELEVLPPLSTTDEDADRLLREADRAADEGRVDEAAARYREIVARHGDDRIAPLAHLGLGRLAVGLGRFDEAITELDRAGQGDAVVAERAALYRGVALHLSGRSADAVPVLAPLLGHTTDPEETRLLLDTLATAALATEQHVMALGALDARLDATEERERPEVLERIREIASRRLRDDQIDLAYDTLRRSGHAWRHVAERALRRAHDTGDLERVRAIAADLTDRGIPLDGALATLVSRAERIAQADVRVIGAILPLSGPAREIGQRALRGLMLAAGTPGHGPQPPDAPLLVFRDDASDPERAVRAVDELVSVHRAVAIVGPLDPACAEAAAARAIELGVPMLSLAASETTVSSPLVFRLYPTLDEELATLLDTAFSRGARSVAVLHPSTRWGQRVSASVRRDVEARGGSISADEGYAATATTFTAEVARVAAAHPDAIVIADAGPRIALIAPALATVGLWAPGSVPATGPAPARRGHTSVRPRAVQILVPSVGIDARLPATAGRYLQGALFAAPFLATPSSAVAGTSTSTPASPGSVAVPTDLSSFTATYRAQFQSEPDAFSAYAFDAFGLVRRAVLAGAPGRAEVARWLATSSAGTPTIGASGGLAAERRPFRAAGLVTLSGTAFAPM
jgi:ABC-type branched-subunit amino acid transport system substrate-binding protein